LTLQLIPDPSDKAPSRPLSGEVDDREYRDLFDHAGVLLAILDAEGRFISVNAACRRVLGYEPAQLIGCSLFDFVQAAGAQDVGEGSSRRRADDKQRDPFVELLARHPHADGSWRWLRWSGDTQGERWYAAARDVTDTIKLEGRVGRDVLTQLPNRGVFVDELTAALSEIAQAPPPRFGVLDTAASSARLGVLFVDIDGLKQVNDGIGHDAGDRLITEVAERLRSAVRGEDLVARLGGDEFGVIVRSLADPSEVSRVAERILELLGSPIELGRGPVANSASIGIAVLDDPATSAAELIHRADLAMYRAKAQGRNRYVVFDAQMRAELQLQLDMERDLHHALARGELALHYQPIVSLADNSIVGAEALLRWNHPDRGILNAAEFLPLAEQNGLILPLGRWVLQTAARQAASWSVLDGPQITVSVNISPRQLADEELLDMVRNALETSGLAPQYLCLEIGESALLADAARVASRVVALRGLGVQIAFDDFGAGDSLLGGLPALPVDAIKLGRDFVKQFSSDPASPARAVLIATIAAARELGMRLIACGVEDPSQLDVLRAVGCAFAQGNAVAPATSDAVQRAGDAIG
jgi:diguanylate cyclase (GGDEF)-like protein/PAS domain S-box-containing protein